MFRIAVWFTGVNRLLNHSFSSRISNITIGNKVSMYVIAFSGNTMLMIGKWRVSCSALTMISMS